MASKIVESLLGELTAFETQHWSSIPLVRRADDVEYVKNLLTLQEADRIIKSPSARPPYMEIVRDARRLREHNWIRSAGSRSVMVQDSIDVDAAAEEFGRGATIIFNHLDEFQAANRRLCDGFTSTFNAMTKSMAFITPPGQQGFGVHFDTFEGFIIQTHGAKRWYVFEQVTPLQESPSGLRRSDVGDPVLEATLHPGDVLYIPWGSPHYAVSEDTVSCHLTVMVFPGGWGRAMATQLKAAVPAAAYDELVPLVADFDILKDRAEHHLERYVESLRTADVATWASQIIAHMRPPQPVRTDFLQQAILRADLSADSKVSSVAGTSAVVMAADAGQVNVRIGSKVLRLPLAALEVVERLRDADAVRLGDLADSLSEQAVVTLAGHLLDQGLLRIASASD
jgi:lysine-specific demethylase/histidyl-hydroxylase NO66